MVATDWERMISRSFQWDVSEDGIVNSKYDTRLQDEKFITNLHIIFEHSAPSNTQLRTPLRTSKVWVQHPQSPPKKTVRSAIPSASYQNTALRTLGARSIYSFWAPLSLVFRIRHVGYGAVISPCHGAPYGPMHQRCATVAGSGTLRPIFPRSPESIDAQRTTTIHTTRLYLRASPRGDFRMEWGKHLERSD